MQTADRAPSEDPWKWTRVEVATLSAFVVGALVSLIWLVHPWYEPANDASLYILTARSLAAGEGYSYLGQPFSVRPPGFSAMLAPILALRGTDFQAMNVFVSLNGIAALALLFALVRRRLGVLVTFALCVGLWLDADFQHLCNQVLSDVPGMSALFACFALERWGAHRPSRSRELVLGVAIGLAALVRTVNVLVLPAILAARWLARRRLPAAERRSWRAEFAPIVLGAVFVLAPWSARDAAVAPKAPVDQNYLYSQWTNLLHTDAADPGSPFRPASEFVERLPRRFAQLASLIGTRMSQPRGDTNAIAFGVLILLAAAIQLVRKRGSMEIFLVLAILPLLFFQAFLDRHALPVFVIAFALALEGLLEAARRLRVAPRVGRIGVAVLLAAFLFVDVHLHEGWDRIRSNHVAMKTFCDSVRAKLTPDARVASYLGWHDSVYLERPVWSLMFGYQRGRDAGLDAVVAKYAIDTLILADFQPADDSLRGHFEPLVKSREDVELGTVLRLK